MQLGNDLVSLISYQDFKGFMLMFSIYEAGENDTVVKNSILYIHEGKLTSKVSPSNRMAVSEKSIIFFL